MASNISVAITVDNKQYIAGIKAADTATTAFARKTQQSLGGIGTAFTTAGNQVSGFATKLAGLGFAAATVSAIRFGDSIKDISDATGIGIANVIGFSNVVAANGGSAESAQKAILKFVGAIDEAASGSREMQNTFKGVNVSLKDLANLSEQDLLAKTIEGLSKITSASERVATAQKLLGKEFRAVNLQAVADGYQSASGAAAKYTETINKTAELQNKLDSAFQKLQLAILKAIEPLADFVSKLTDDQIDKMVQAVIALGSAFTALAVAAPILQGIGRALAFLGGAFAVAKTGMAAITAGTALFAGALVSLNRTAVFAAGYLDRFSRGTGMFKAENGAIANLITLFGKLAARIPFATVAFAALSAAFGGMLLGLGKIAVAFASIALAVVGINELIKLAFNIDLIDMMAKKLEELVTTYLPGVAALLNKIGSALGMAAPPSSAPKEGLNTGSGPRGSIGTGRAAEEERKKIKGPVRDVDTTATDNAVKAIREMTVEYEKQQRLNLAKIDFETRFIGLSEESKTIAEAQVQLAQDYSKQQDELIKKRESLTKEERKEGVLGKEINEQIKKNAQGFNAQFAAITKSVTAQQTAKKLEEDRLYFIDLQTKSMNTILDIQANIASFSMSEDARKIAALQRQIALEEDAAVKREQQRLGATPITAEAEAAVREKVRKATEGQLAAQLQLNAATKAESARLFVQDLQNTAIANTISLQAELAKLTMTSDQQRILDLQTQNQLLVQQEVAKRNALLKPGESIAASEIAAITAQVTAANATLIASTQGLIDKGREFTTGWTQSFIKYKDDAENAATQSKTYFETFTKGFEDAFVKFVQTGKLSFKDLANSMIADFARIQAKKALLGIFGAGGGDSTGGGFSFGTLFKGIGSIFGFANGGSPPVNRPSIVGERGPELFIPKSAGTVVPNGMMGGGQTINTAVTYSIQAVDASSFKSLLARDPEFIHNVAEQGRRQLPIRSRR
jgi:lambda family phage tail tape measure protein